MKATHRSPPAQTPSSPPTDNRPSVGIRDLKARVSAIIDAVKTKGVTYAVTRRREVQALIIPAEPEGQSSSQGAAERAWEAWQAVVDELLSSEQGKTLDSAVAELDRMRR